MDQCRTKTEIGHYFCQATPGNVCTKCLHDDEYNCLSCPNWAESMKAKGFTGTPITSLDDQVNDGSEIKCPAEGSEENSQGSAIVGIPCCLHFLQNVS